MSLEPLMKRLASAACKKDHNQKTLLSEQQALDKLLSLIDKENNLQLDIVSKVMESHDKIEGLEIEQKELEESIQDIKKHLEKYGQMFTGKRFKHHSMVGQTNCWVTVEFALAGTVELHYEFQPL